MNPSESSTIEQVLFERMGVTVEDALATGTDVIDEKVAAASEQGIDVDQRLGELSKVMIQLTEPFLAPIRRVLPSLGGLDLSVLVAIVALQALQILFTDILRNILY